MSNPSKFASGGGVAAHYVVQVNIRTNIFRGGGVALAPPKDKRAGAPHHVLHEVEASNKLANLPPTNVGYH